MTDTTIRDNRDRPNIRLIGAEYTLPPYIEVEDLPDSLAIPARHDNLYEFGKRIVDIIGALIIALVALPIMAVVALTVLSTSPGPVIFRQKRLGRAGVPFSCYKFRTMVVDAEEVLKTRPDLMEQFQNNFKLKEDPRTTPVGRFLRKSSLDELPQLLNVLKGQMSLVGPRPIVPAELDKYGRFSDKFLSVQPGLTGVWQVTGRSDVTYAERVEMDMKYIDQRTLVKDVGIVFMTVITVFTKSGAY